MASTWLLFSASRYSVTGSSAATDAAMPTLRSWSAAVLATAIEVGSFDATPIASASCLPSLLIRPRITSGGPVVVGGGVESGVGDTDTLLSIWNPEAENNARAACLVIAGGAV